MQIDIIETEGLGDRSYLVSDGGIGVAASLLARRLGAPAEAWAAAPSAA